MRENNMDMRNNTAVSEVFYAAFKALDRPQRELTIARLLQDREVRQDLFDLALIQRAKGFKGRPIEARRYFSKRRSER